MTGSRAPGERTGGPSADPMATPLRLETSDLLLRPLAVATAARIIAGRRGVDWAEGFPQEGDLSIARVVLASALGGRSTDVALEPPDSLGAWGPWGLWRDGRLVGTAGFHGPPDEGTVEIGYGVVEEHRGRGLATQAVTALLGFARQEGIAHVVAHVYPANEPSVRLLVGRGFHAVARRNTSDDRSAESDATSRGEAEPSEVRYALDLLADVPLHAS